MAKLSAHGEEIARFTHQKTGVSYAFMEDRWILVKRMKGDRWRRFKRTMRIGEGPEFRATLLKKGFVLDERRIR